MHHMSTRMCLASSKTPFTVNSSQHLRTTKQFALFDPNAMHDQALHGALHIDDLQLYAVADDPAGVGVLATRLGIERRLLEDDLDQLALLGGLGKRPVHDDAADLRL